METRPDVWSTIRTSCLVLDSFPDTRKKESLANNLQACHNGRSASVVLDLGSKGSDLPAFIIPADSAVGAAAIHHLRPWSIRFSAANRLTPTLGVIVDHSASSEHATHNLSYRSINRARSIICTLIIQDSNSGSDFELLTFTMSLQPLLAVISAILLVLIIIDQPFVTLRAVTINRMSSRALLEDNGRMEFEEALDSNGSRNSSPPELRFSVIHRQHPSSPYREVHKTHSDLMQEHVRRGLLRLESLQKLTAAEQQSSRNSDSNTMPLTTARDGSSKALEERVQASGGGEWQQGEYMVQMQLGTPARTILLIIDTGSGLTWVQCSECMQCFLQQEPIFNPIESKSYRTVGCANPACDANSIFQCSETHNRTCEYGVQYGMTSFTTGIVSTDTLTVGESHGIEKFLFGCGLFNVGDQMVGSSGVLGLSRSNISFPMQLARASGFTRKFTHCFADLAENRNATSFMYLGDSRSHQLKFTPFAKTPFTTQFYYLDLQGISVEKKLLSIPPSVFRLSPDGGGGTVIDSGTTLTVLVQPAYVVLRDAFRAAAASKHRLNSTAIPGGLNDTLVTSHVVDTCYRLGESYSRDTFENSDWNLSKMNFKPGVKDSKSGRNSKKHRLQVPRITLHFAGGVDLSLPPNNVLFPFDDGGLYCLAFTGSMSDVGMNVIGNIQQQNFRIQYDLENSRIGFGRAYCASENV
ncbi:hypothetical protein R1flu_012800 [Riccia fluitans]|uniref:Peptidase A1 domain-containing protein n=1 Tax=Riccia fluitans TaxID=41844 RepID=A0ABD1ZCU8_9MARC